MGWIKFKNHFKQLAVTFKIYADFKYLSKGVQSSDKNNTSYTEKYNDHIPCSFAFKVVCTDDKTSKNLFFTQDKMKFIDSLKQFLKSMIIVKKSKQAF